MTIFDFITSVLVTKQKNCLNSVDEESEFSPYMLNRWLSMYSPSVALCSNVLNKYLSVFESKKDLYSLFISVMPKVASKRISYIKKVKEEKKEENTDIAKIAQNLELSEREISQYIAFKQTIAN
jgi:hypothetical protein